MFIKHVYGLAYDFFRDQETYLCIRREPAFQIEDVVPLEFNMLQYNEIPGLLKLEFAMDTNEVTLRYHIGSRKMLKHYLQASSISLNSLYEVLKSIILRIQDLNAYMLDGGRIIFKSEFIFIGSKIDEVYLTYLPLHEVDKNESVLEAFKQLIISFLPYTQELSGSGIQAMLRALDEQVLRNEKEPDWTLLLTIIEEHHPSSSVMDNEITESRKDFRIDLPERSDPQSNINLPTVNEGHPEENKLDQEAVHQELNSKPKYSRGKKETLWLVLSFMLLLIGLSLIYYTGNQYYSTRETPYLYIAVGLLMFWLEGLYLTHKLGIRSRRNIASADEPEQFISDEVQPPMSWQQYRLNLAEQTTLLSTGGDVTEWIGPNAQHDHLEPQRDKEVKAYLHMQHQEQLTVIEVNRPRFIIGRGPDDVDCAVTFPLGVSRVHIEIERREDGYYIQDLGSKNGSQLNGQLLSPYKPHRLKRGDLIHVMQNEWIFHQEGT